MFPTPKTESKISLTTLALIGISLGVALFGLWYFHVEPVYTWTTGVLTPIVESARGIGQTIIPTIQNAWTAFLQNPIPYIAGGVTTVSGLYAIISKVRSIRAEEAKQQAVTDNIQISQAYTELEAKYKTGQEQLKNLQSPDSKSLVEEAQSLVTQTKEQNRLLDEENTRLKATVQSLQDMLLLKDTKVIKKTVVK